LVAVELECVKRQAASRVAQHALLLVGYRLEAALAADQRVLHRVQAEQAAAHAPECENRRPARAAAEAPDQGVLGGRQIERPAKRVWHRPRRAHDHVASGVRRNHVEWWAAAPRELPSLKWSGQRRQPRALDAVRKYWCC